MANNRMWLKNKRTGAQILLAKYYPSTGWYPFHEDLHAKLGKLFEENEPNPSQWGDNEWSLEYEQSTESIADLLREAMALIEEAREQPDDLQGEVDAKIDRFKNRAEDALRTIPQEEAGQ